jgi:hypothetical protein
MFHQKDYSLVSSDDSYLVSVSSVVFDLVSPLPRPQIRVPTCHTPPWDDLEDHLILSY